MLDSRKSKSFNENKVVSIVGPGTTVNGEINSKGTIRIEGAVTGRIQSSDTIVVLESGSVKTDLVAGQVIISGDVHGNVFAHERLELTANGKVMGDITAPRVSLSEGVLFEGHCTMKPPGQAKPPGRKNDRTPKPQGGGPEGAAETRD